MSILIRKFLKLIYPFVEFISKTHLPFTRKKITGEYYYRAKDKLLPGDVLLTVTRGELSNLINPAKWKHGAIYYGIVDGVHKVFESTGRGAHLKDLVSFLTTKDYIKVYRHERRVNIWNLRSYLDSVEGLPYDKVFSSENKSLYCFEVVAVALSNAVDGYEAKTQKILGERVYTDETFTDDISFNNIII